ncbi:helix-turn-helix transcriptional regulator [Marinicrinis lubricantis]|uniref:AraC family transcriptional regulator n=1 Tax=Marinicrinis lubricantis TaxID=2086470 RepID=A0ABW1IVQ6_9BACL
MKKHIFPILSEVDRKLPVYVTTVGEWDHQNPMTRGEEFSDFQWIQCIGGSGKLYIHEKEYEIKPGQGMLLFPRQSHHYEAMTSPWSVFWISFNGEAVHSVLEQHGIRTSGVYAALDPQYMLAKLYGIQDVLQHEIHGQYKASPIMYEMLLRLSLWVASPGSMRADEAAGPLTPVLQYIERHYAERLTLQMLAELIPVTRSYLCTLFKQLLGMSPMEYVTQKRISKSKELLLTSREMQIQEVAASVGYENTSYFIKLFKNIEAVSPHRFRKMH